MDQALRGPKPPYFRPRFCWVTQLLINLEERATLKRQRDGNPCHSSYREAGYLILSNIQQRKLTLLHQWWFSKYWIEYSSCMHPFCGGLLSQQGGSDPIRGSGQIVYTLEVYTLLYSYISVKYVSLLIIARANSCNVGCSLVLGWRWAFLYLEEFGQQRETEKCWWFFPLWDVISSCFESQVLHYLQHWLETVVCCIASGRLLWKHTWGLQLSDILMIQYWCNAL